MRIRKAVIPAAGLGTRVLPATKSVPKEMFPILDKPAIQYIVEEAVASGIEKILVVISRGKDIIENHFDRSPELEDILFRQNKLEMLEDIRKISNFCEMFFVRQKEASGLGNAVLCAETFVGNEPFAVLYGDDVILSKKPVCAQLIEAFEVYGLGVLGAKEVAADQIHRYGSLKVEHLENNWLKCTDMVEKPDVGMEMSLYSILGRCVLTPDIFDILKHTSLGAGNEIQLTDAMRELARSMGMIVVDFEGKRYDMGNKLEIAQAYVDVALAHSEIGRDFKNYIKKIVLEL
jgi:UTP--glucose-1-phosphate uridylyltransferase